MAGQYYSTSTLGGNWSQPYLTQRMRNLAQPLFKLRQFADVKEAIGKNRGDTWLFDKSGNVATQGGTLVGKTANYHSNMIGDTLLYARNSSKD